MIFDVMIFEYVAKINILNNYKKIQKDIFYQWSMILNYNIDFEHPFYICYYRLVLVSEIFAKKIVT